MQMIIVPYGAQHHYRYVTLLSKLQQPAKGGKRELDCCNGEDGNYQAIEAPTTYASGR